jgi:hypothetical protein
LIPPVRPDFALDEFQMDARVTPGCGAPDVRPSMPRPGNRIRDEALRFLIAG